MNQLLEILRVEGKQLVEEFHLASEQGDGTPQEVADFRENAVQGFVARYYPQSHIVSKGKVTDLEGNQSDSIDCLILNPAHPHLVDSKGKFRLIFADGCDAAIEVKPNLARTDELHRALNQCISVKKTRRSKTAMLTRKEDAHIVEHSRHVPFFVFAVKAFEPAALYSAIGSFYQANCTPIEHQVDGVCIIGQGILTNVKHKELNVYAADFPVGRNSGWYFEKWGESTAVGLLVRLEYTFPSWPSLTDSIMKRVLTKIGRTAVERLGDLVC